MERGGDTTDIRPEAGKLLGANHDDKSSTLPKQPGRPFLLPLFVFNFSMLQLIQMTVGVYFIGIMRTLEKRFGLTSTTTGIIMSVNDVIHICLVVFVGYFGRRGNKPRMISVTAMFFVVGSLLMASPYFIYGAEKSANEITLSNSSLTSVMSTVERCQANNTVACATVESTEYIDTVVALLILGSLFNGVGGVAIQTLGMAYVDENAEKTKSSMYLGIISSTFAIGPILGFALAMFCTKLPENLMDSHLSPDDPQWIGAWWLGYLICAVLIFITSFPIFFYPKVIAEHSDRQDPRPTADKLNSDEKPGFLSQVKEFPKSIKVLLSNKSYVLFLGSMVFSLYLIPGFFMQVPKYIESHFRQPAFVSNIAAGIPAVAGVFGGFLGGAIMTKAKIGIKGGIKMLIFSAVAMMLGLIALMFISCPEVQINGAWTDDGHFSMSLPCNTNCSCTVGKSTFDPVCGSDGYSYFSPCFAGCTHEVHTENQSTLHQYSGCACLPGSMDIPQARAGYCEARCDTQFYVFVATAFVMSFLSSLGRVPGAIIQFRVVGKNDGSFALGVTSFVINLLVFIPGPVLFGAIIDSTCLIVDTACSQSGACLLFDTSDFRIRTFGLSAALTAASIVWMVAMLLTTKKPVREQSVIDTEDLEYVKYPETTVKVLADQ